jgi:predicted membrane protein
MDNNGFIPSVSNHGRKAIGIRLLYTILFFIVFEILKTVFYVIVFFQYIHLFISKKHNEPVRVFSNKVSTYAYRVMRYLSLNENARPFPFSNFPDEVENPDSSVTFS